MRKFASLAVIVLSLFWFIGASVATSVVTAASAQAGGLHKGRGGPH